jgi:hypothetical protein
VVAGHDVPRLRVEVDAAVAAVAPRGLDLREPGRRHPSGLEQPFDPHRVSDVQVRD